MNALRLLTLIFLLAPQGAFAFLEGAEAAFRRGQQYERLKNYSAAIVEYQSALSFYPNYFYAHRQIGNCYAFQQQPAKALEAYDKYLSANPMDSQVRAYADRLRGGLGFPPLNQELSQGGVQVASTAAMAGQGPAQPQGFGLRIGGLKKGFFAGAQAGMVMLNVDDINALVSEGSKKASASPGIAYGALAGWQHDSGFYVLGAYESGLNKAHNWEDPDISSLKTSASTVYSHYYVAPGFQVRLLDRLSLGAQLGFGQGTYTGTVKSEIGGTELSKQSFTQAAQVMLYELKGEYMATPNFGVHAILGMQSGELAKAESGSSNIKDAKGNDAKFNYSGLRLGLGAEWHF